MFSFFPCKSRKQASPPGVALFVLEDEGDRLVQLSGAIAPDCVVVTFRNAGWARPPGSGRRAGGSSSDLRLTSRGQAWPASLSQKFRAHFGPAPRRSARGTLQGRFPPARLPHPGGARGASSRYELPFPAWNPPGDGAADRLVNFSKIAESLSSPCALADRE